MSLTFVLLLFDLEPLRQRSADLKIEKVHVVVYIGFFFFLFFFIFQISVVFLVSFCWLLGYELGS